MKFFKILSLLAVALVSFTSCGETNDEPTGPNNELPAGPIEKIVNQWRLATVNGVEAEFDVYIDIKDDASFELYQMVYSNQYYLYKGTYELNDQLFTGSYLGGNMWKCDYIVGISEDEQRLTMISVEDQSITCVYEATTIPEDVKQWAVTRALDVVPFL